MNDLGKKIIIIVLVLAALAVGGALWWKQDTLQKTANLGAVNVAVNPTPSVPEPVSLIVDDQFPGPLVFVSEVKLPAGGWVVIHREEDGAPGAIAGAGYFDHDVITGEVNLSAPSREGEKYYAVVYHDDGDLKFDPSLDQVYRDPVGQILLKSFVVTRNLPERKG